MLASASPAFGAKTPSSAAKLEALKPLILRDLESRRSLSFKAMLRHWETEYGTRAVSPLLQIAGDTRVPESQRYIATMGVAKLGGAAVAPRIVPLLRDSSWMIRTGALRALTALRNSKTTGSVLPLLRDPALAVRIEAVEAVQKLRPPGAAAALVSILERPENYHARKAQWVPQRALSALQALNAREMAPKLLPLLDRLHDEDLVRRTIETLESLTGKKLAAGKPLSDQAKAWKEQR